MPYIVEHTDTFAGESNYAWVRRTAIDPPHNNPSLSLSRLSLVRRAKRWAGLSGIRSRVDSSGDMLAIYPSGMCQVIFIYWEDDAV